MIHSDKFTVIATIQKMCDVIENLERTAMFFTINHSEMKNLSIALDDYIDEVEFMVKEKDSLIAKASLNRALMCKRFLRKMIQERGDE